MKGKMIKIFSLILIFWIVGFSIVTKASYWGTPDLTENWLPIIVNPNSITVVYEVKYGSTCTINCIGLWENKINFMLTFKDSDGRRLQKENIVSIYYKLKGDDELTRLW
jgi:hypothetical protein